MEKRLIKLLLNREFFLSNSKWLLPTMFPLELRKLYDTLLFCHSTLQTEQVSIQDLYDLTLARNPAMTFAAKQNLEIMIEEVVNEPTPHSAIAQEIVKSAYKREIARQVGETAINIINGRDGSFDDIRRLLDGYVAPVGELIAIEDDLDALLRGTAENTRWQFNIATLRERVAGIGPGTLTILAGRPETGKTGLWVSFAAAPGGWCHQGAKVDAILNEEPAHRTALRCWSACSGLDRVSITQRREEAGRAVDPIRGKLRYYDAVGVTMDQLYTQVELSKPDILVIDQLDKVRVDGEFNRGDEKLREIYTRARELAKIGNCAIVAISQLSADAQGQAYPDLSMFENSKTGKAAEADLAILMGANPNISDDNTRYLNLAKNKLSGDHGCAIVKIHPEVSRFTA